MQGRLLVGAQELEGHGRCQSPGRVRCNEGLGGALAPVGGGPLAQGASLPSFDGATPSRGGASNWRRQSDEGGSSPAGARPRWLAAETRRRNQERRLKLRALKSGNQRLFFHRFRAEKRMEGRDGARMRRMLVLPDSVLRRLTDYEFSGADGWSAGGSAKPSSLTATSGENAREASAATRG
jgi:hypothetical protein